MRKRKNPDVEELGRVPLFSASTPEELRLVDQLTYRMSVAPGRVLVHEGGRGREFFVIVSGRAEVSRHGEPVAELGSGDFFGELALLAEHGWAARNATVTALTPMQVLVFTPAEFEAALAGAPAMTHKILVAMAGRPSPSIGCRQHCAGADGRTGGKENPAPSDLSEGTEQIQQTGDLMRHLGPAHSLIRRRAQLAVELYWTPDRDRRVALSDEAVAIARRAGDPATLAHADG